MHKLLTSLLIATLALAGGQASALQRDSREVRQESPAPSLQTMQSGGVTLSQAVEQVRRQYKGRIVSAETQVNGNRETHVIKVLTEDGKVKTVRVPGKKRG